MKAISLRPPLGNATAYWGRDCVPRGELPHPNMIGTEIAIHQGKRWDDAARLKASEYAATLKDFRVSLDPKGYPQGIVAVATLGAFIDFTGEVNVVAAREMGYPALALPMCWGDDGPADILEDDDGSPLPAPDGLNSATGVLVASPGMFSSSSAASQFALNAVGTVRDWGDAVEGVVWCFRKVTPFMNAVGCAGKHGIFNLDRNTMDTVRQRLRA